MLYKMCFLLLSSLKQMDVGTPPQDNDFSSSRHRRINAFNSKYNQHLSS